MTCRHCDDMAVRGAGCEARCAKHYRFVCMRATARRRGKSVPTMAELEAMAAVGMNCPHCQVAMHWLARVGGYKSVVTLQHNRDGSMQFLCMSCNTKHQHLPGDQFYVNNSNDSRICTQCKLLLPNSEFFRRKSVLLRSECRRCSASKLRAWRKAHPERVREYQHRWKQRRQQESRVEA